MVPVLEFLFGAEMTQSFVNISSISGFGSPKCSQNREILKIVMIKMVFN
jgi:hypothetical protein